MSLKQFTAFLVSTSLLLILTACEQNTSKDWVLDSKHSSVNFVSIKKENIAEVHFFNDFSGAIVSGQAEILLKADSIESNVSIRNQRMRKLLFETDKYPVIKVKANVTRILEKINSATPLVSQLPATLSLHGIEQDVILDVYVTKTKQGITVVSQKPVIVKGSRFKLDDGIKQLSELVNNIAIAQTTPVSFVLNFK